MSNNRERMDWDAAKRRLQQSEAALERALIPDAEKIERTYRERAVQMANRRAAAATNVRTMNVLVFSLGPETYGMPISDLVEVLSSTRCTLVPRAAAEIVGVINLRGELRTVIDLARLLELPDASGETFNSIFILRKEAGDVGLKVGRVDRVQSIQEDELVTVETRSPDSSDNYFKGLSPEKIIVIDTAALLSHRVFKTSTR
jgi:purine-binding chemotaxis protein CheW